mmetsp:Transcript_20634/g.58733  ORF Transcript_20634/g.58733 Transcript_20634/m.58733 type:complete len:259 (-) Transcript_20634:74-850(-)
MQSSIGDGAAHTARASDAAAGGSGGGRLRTAAGRGSRPEAQSGAAAVHSFLRARGGKGEWNGRRAHRRGDRAGETRLHGRATSLGPRMVVWLVEILGHKAVPLPCQPRHKIILSRCDLSFCPGAMGVAAGPKGKEGLGPDRVRDRPRGDVDGGCVGGRWTRTAPAGCPVRESAAGADLAKVFGWRRDGLHAACAPAAAVRGRTSASRPMVREARTAVPSAAALAQLLRFLFWRNQRISSSSIARSSSIVLKNTLELRE